MKPFKQSLCRLLLPLVRAVLVCGLLLGVLVPLARSQAQTPAQVVRNAPGPALAPEQVLTQSVQQWVARQRSVRPEQVQLMALDARVKVQPCVSDLLMDQPFATAETVRVRCPEPAWQLYMRVKSIAPGPGGAGPAPPPAASAEMRRPVVVAGQALLRGMTVQPGQVRLQEMVLSPSAGAYMDDPEDALHSEVLRDIPAGSPVRRSDLRPLVLVKRGQLVQLSVGKSTGFVVSARVEAMQDGRMGEQIKLKNNESGRILSGVVRGPGVVEGN